MLCVTREKIDDSILHIISHAGHLSNLENPGEFNDQINKFVDSVYNKQLNINYKMENHSNEIQPDSNEQNPKKTFSNDYAEADLNSKILKITMTIMDQYPELSKYIEEMPVTIPTENNPEITLVNLKAYYESLNLMLNKYKTEHPTIEN